MSVLTPANPQSTDTINEPILDITIPLRRKRQPAASSLLSSLKPAATANRDKVMKQLGLSNGVKLFPSSSFTIQQWVPPQKASGPTDGDFCLPLDNFSAQGAGNDTLVVKAFVPSASKRWSFNIAAPDHDGFDSILFHFNPRQRQRGGILVLNDKTSGTWGNALNIPLNQVPVIFGQERESLTISVQISATGYNVFVDNRLCARLERPYSSRKLQNYESLFLQCPSTDDSGKREDWTLQQVWWGKRGAESAFQTSPIDLEMADGAIQKAPQTNRVALEHVAGANDFDREHPTRLFIRGLAKVNTRSATEQRRAVLERTFFKYGGQHGVRVIVPKNRRFAFVEVKSREAADDAIEEMGRHFLICRAQRSAKEASEKPQQSRDLR